MNPSADFFLQSIKLVLEKVGGIVEFKPPPEDRQNKALADPLTVWNVLGVAVVRFGEQELHYQFPWPLSNGAFLLKGELRRSGLFFSKWARNDALNLDNVGVWAGEV